MDLTEFVTPRLADDEREIRNDPPAGMGYAVLPVRMLREVKAKRAILAAWQDAESKRPDDDAEYAHGYADGLADGLRAAVLTLASAWSEHPDYGEITR